MTQPCTLVKADALDISGADHSFWACALDPADASEKTGYMVQLQDYDLSSGQDSNGLPIQSGNTKFFATGTSLEGQGKARVPKNAKPKFDHSHGQRRLAVTTGSKTVLAIRVNALDSLNTYDEG